MFGQLRTKREQVKEFIYYTTPLENVELLTVNCQNVRP